MKITDRPACLDLVEAALNAKDSNEHGVYTVTQGEWFAREPGNYYHDGLRKIMIMDEDGSKICRLLMDVSSTRGKSEPEQLNAKFITACSPSNITALLDYVRSLEEQIETARGDAWDRETRTP